MPTPPPVDRRQRKTRSALQAALLSLIAERPYPRITVDAIVSEADVARATFYSHYRDKNDLLAATCEQLMQEFLSTMQAATAPSPTTYDGSGVAKLLRHVDSNRDLYRVLITGQAGSAARQVLITTFTEAAGEVLARGADVRNSTPRLPLPMVTASLVGGLLLVMEQWLQGNLAVQAETLGAGFMRSQVSGLEWSLGFEPGQLRYVREPQGSRGSEENLSANELDVW